jgi:hypothetical protein
MYNNGNSSKNVTGASIVDGTVETVDIADDAVTADKLANSVNTDIATGVTASTTAGDALPKAGGAMTGTITGFESTGIDDRLPTGKVLTLNTTGIDVTGNVICHNLQATSLGTNNATATIERPTGNTATLTAGKSTGFTIDSDDTNGGEALTRFTQNGTEKVRIQAGGGISFNGDTAAANALDDYEEGTWTPNWVGATGTSTGTYTKIGNVVHYTAQIVVDGALTGGVTISGHPFGIGLGHNTSVILRDIGANIYAGTTSESGITIYFISPSTGGVSTLSATVPFTWVSGDKIFVSTTHRV